MEGLDGKSFRPQPGSKETWFGQWGLPDPMCLLEKSHVVKECLSSSTPVMLS